MKLSLNIKDLKMLDFTLYRPDQTKIEKEIIWNNYQKLLR